VVQGTGVDVEEVYISSNPSISHLRIMIVYRSALVLDADVGVAATAASRYASWKLGPPRMLSFRALARSISRSESSISEPFGEPPTLYYSIRSSIMPVLSIRYITCGSYVTTTV
jgi:hypothetical protein